MKVWIAIFVLLIVGALAFYLYSEPDEIDTNEVDELVETKPFDVIGVSLEWREIQAYRFGATGGGEKKLLLIGAIHGGYEWNTAVLSYEFIDYFLANPETIPSGIEIVVVPVANPDGLYKTVGTSERFSLEDAPKFEYRGDVPTDSAIVSGRFNANGVDLNRNFDCKWKPDAIWGDDEVSAGDSVFSEPESKVLRDFFIAEEPTAIIFFHSAANGIYPSFCEGDPSEETAELAEIYSVASGYPSYENFASYEVTGDAGDWASKLGIPSITVELSTHSAIEFEENLAGVDAALKHYSESVEF